MGTKHRETGAPVWYMGEPEIMPWQETGFLTHKHFTKGTLKGLKPTLRSPGYNRTQHIQTTQFCCSNVIFLSLVFLWVLLLWTLSVCVYLPLWPFGLCHLRAYRRLWSAGWVRLLTAPHWDKKMEGFCQDYCLHRPKKPAHKTSQSSKSNTNAQIPTSFYSFNAMRYSLGENKALWIIKL